MNDTKVSVETLLPPEAVQRTGWRRYFTRQRLRMFILLSVAAHLALGLSWGIPAYGKQRRLEAEMRRQEAVRDQQRKAAEAALARAKARDLAQSIQDVHDQTHKAFEAIAGELNQADKDKTWAAVQPKV